jgi:hypothetical protein
MKLEIKHLCPYLPYELSGIVGSDTKISYMEMLSHFSICTGVNIKGVQSWFKITSFKPILKPSSDIKKYATEIKLMGYKTDSNTFFNMLSDLKDGKLEYDLMQLFIKEHIDVFGLIDKGLAINMNEVANYDR